MESVFDGERESVTLLEEEISSVLEPLDDIVIDADAVTL